MRIRGEQVKGFDTVRKNNNTWMDRNGSLIAFLYIILMDLRLIPLFFKNFPILIECCDVFVAVSALILVLVQLIELKVNDYLSLGFFILFLILELLPLFAFIGCILCHIEWSYYVAYINICASYYGVSACFLLKYVESDYSKDVMR